MSLLASPLVLFLFGLAVARLAKHRRVWRRHSRFPRTALSLVLVLYSALMLGLFIDHRWTRGLSRGLPGQSGTDWVVNSGILRLDASWPVADPLLLAGVVAAFMLFPLWLYFGFTAGQWLFGTNPRQTGVLGLLR